MIRVTAACRTRPGAVLLFWIALSCHSALSAFEVIGPKWNGATTSFRINPNFPDTALAGPAEKQIETLLCAAAAWREQSRSQFQFVYLGTTTRNTFNQNDGVNIIAYSSADGGDALAATLIDGQGSRATAFDVLFFDKTNGTKNRWSGSGLPQPGEYDIGGVATHELGHGLGLDHSAIPQATMFASASGRAIGLRTLHPDDRDGVEFLYGTRTTTQPAVKITSITPSEGFTAGENEVVILGENFTYEADTQLRLGSELLSSTRFNVENCSTIRITNMPAHSAGAISIEITNTVGTASRTDGYRYLGPVPRISGVSPAEGPPGGGILVEITGENITLDAIVTIGGLPLGEQQVIGATKVTGKLPGASAGGAVDVKLNQGGEESVLAGAFTYNPFLLRLADVMAIAGQTEIPVTAHVTSPDELSQVTFGFLYDSSRLSVEAATAAGTAARDAEFVDANIQNGAGVTTVRVIMDVDGSAITLPAGTDVSLVTLLMKVSNSAMVGSRIDLVIKGNVGVPPVQLSFTRAMSATTVRPLTTDGSVTVIEGILFLRGDMNGDGRRDISDAVFLLDFLFRGGPRNPCQDASDSNDDGDVDISDAVNLLLFLFQGFPSLPPPFPGPGIDPTPDPLGCR